MLGEILLLLCGLALIVFGADYLVDGASDVARRYGISEFVIGLTIVGMGTSAPEMVVSFIGAIEGNADVSIGNVLGSNIFNTLLILGLTAIILPIAITPENRRRDIPMGILVTLVTLFLGLSHTIFGIGNDGLNRVDGVVLLGLFAFYIWQCFHFGNKDEDSPAEVVSRKLWVSIVYILLSLAALIFGGQLFVNNAVDLAGRIGVSDKFIAVTLLAGGTSLPELATCIAAAVKKKGQLALGNIVGSNIFNLLLVLGGAALIHPLSFASINFVDAGVLVASSVLLIFVRKNFGRGWGITFFVFWLAYMAYLVIQL